MQWVCVFAEHHTNDAFFLQEDEMILSDPCFRKITLIVRAWDGLKTDLSITGAIARLTRERLLKKNMCGAPGWLSWLSIELLVSAQVVISWLWD